MDNNSSNAIVISHETLIDFLRNEKSREEIQELPTTFYADLIAYLKEKKEQIMRAKSDNMFSNGTLNKQAENTVTIVREIYERREKKIMLLAINKARTSSNIIDTSNLLPEERHMFDSLVCELTNFRKGILDAILNGDMPSFQVCTPAVEKEEPGKEEKGEKIKKEGYKKIKIANEVPKFVGKNFEEYGPFDEGLTIELPDDIADLLIRKGHANEI